MVKVTKLDNTAPMAHITVTVTVTVTPMRIMENVDRRLMRHIPLDISEAEEEDQRVMVDVRSLLPL